MLTFCLSLMLLQSPAPETLVAPDVVEERIVEPPAPPRLPPVLKPSAVTAQPEVVASPVRRESNWHLDLGLGQARIRSRSARWFSATDPFALSVLGSHRTAGVLADSSMVLSLAVLGTGENDVGSTTLALAVYEFGAGMALDVPQAALLGDWLMPYTRLLVQVTLCDVSAGDLHDTAVSASLAGTAGLRMELGRRRLWHLFAEASYVGRLPRTLELRPDEDDNDTDTPLTSAAVPLGKLHLSGYEAKAGVGLSF